MNHTELFRAYQYHYANKKSGGNLRHAAKSFERIHRSNLVDIVHS